MDSSQQWIDFNEGIDIIFNQKDMTKNQFMKLYTAVYKCCIYVTGRPTETESRANGLKLYRKVEDLLKTHVTQFVTQCNELMGEDVLNIYVKEWLNYNFISKVINGACGYFNSNWLRREIDETTTDLVNIYRLSLIIWKTYIFSPFYQKITNAMLILIERERNGETCNMRLVSEAIKSYVEIGQDGHNLNVECQNLRVYKSAFEEAYLRESKNFYSRECEVLFENMPVVDCIKKIDQLILEEKRRLQVYLHESSHLYLLEMQNQILIQKNLDIFVNEFEGLLTVEKKNDLKILYSLVLRYPESLIRLRNIFKELIATEGCIAINKCADRAMNDCKLYITTLLIIYNKYKLLITESLQSDNTFHAILADSFAKLVNSNAVTKAANNLMKSAELVSRYCDILLKKSNKNHEESELEELLNQALIIIYFIEDKDVLEKWYAKLLAKRLLHKTSISEDVEMFMIAKLRNHFSIQSISILHKMFVDITVSKDLTECFKKDLSKSNDKFMFDFSIEVLTAGSWSLLRTIELLLPKELEKPFSLFSKFYGNKHLGRKLTWLYQLSTGELVTNCFKHQYTIQLTTLQMAVLLQFNDSTSFTARQLCDNVKIKECILLNVLRIFIKAKLLTSSDSESDLNIDSKVELFTEYRNKKLKINLNVPMKYETKKDVEVTQETIFENRKHVIQAAIVRIMKMRKTLEHQQLINEIFVQVSPRFTASVPLMKICINVLLEKEYIERDKENRAIYNYVA